MKCRISGAELNKFISFGQQPIANGFLLPEQYAKEHFFELAVGFCEKSRMVQLIEQPAPEMMFHDQYAFFSGTSQGMTVHFREFAEMVMKNHLSSSPFVVEIGSNDGIMLKNFAKAGIKHLGIEPSSNVADVARQNGVNTISKFFNKQLASEIVSQYGQADAFLAANVMCHIADFNSVIDGIHTLIKPDGAAIFEEPYLGDVVKKTSYDQFYDEHVFLFSLLSISYAFEQHGLELFDAWPQGTHGGSMRYFIGHQGAKPKSDNLLKLLEAEKRQGLDNPATFERFRANCEKSRELLNSLLRKLKDEGRRVCGYAATSKSTTVLNYCQIGPDLIQYISDTTPIKQGKFSPGMHIPVLPYTEFCKSYPDYAVLFAWNHETEVMAKEDNFKRAGGQWIVFVPEVGVRK